MRGKQSSPLCLSDRLCRLIAFLLTAGQVACSTAAAALLGQISVTPTLRSDRRHDSDAVRRIVESEDAVPVG